MRNVWIVLLAGVGLGAVLYLSDVLPERVLGPALAFALVALPAPYAALRLGQVVGDAKMRAAIFSVSVLAAVLGILSVTGALFPGEALYSGQLTEDQKLVPIGSVAAGAYMLVVEGALPEREGEVSVEYSVRLASAESGQTITGELWRRFDQVRVGRGAAMQERHRTYGKHTVFLKEGQGEVERLSVSPPLPLRFRLHRILLPMSAFVVASAVLFAMGAILEGRFGNDRLRGLLATALAFSASVGLLYPDQISQEALVRPALGVGVTSIFFAILVGGAVAAILRRALRKAPQDAK
jgi:hypothetical protein